MNLRVALSCLTVATLSQAVGCGSSRTPCTSSSCKGCCDPSSGECRFGTFEAACGAFGDACVACGAGMKCTSGRCLLPDGGSAGGAGGGQGGGLGGGGGGAPDSGNPPMTYPTDGGCWQFPTFVEEFQQPSYRRVLRGMGQSPNAFVLELVGESGPVTGTQTLDGMATGFRYVVFFLEGCTRNPPGKFPHYVNCAHEFIGVSGTMTIDTVTGNMSNGGWTGSISNVHLLERLYDGGVGLPTLGTRCADVGFEAVAVTYP